MRRLDEKFVYVLIPLIFGFAYLCSLFLPAEPVRPVEVAALTPEPAEEVVPVSDVQVFEETISPNSTLQDVLFRFDFDSRDVYQLIQETKDVYNLNRLRAGNLLSIETGLDGDFRSLRYQISGEEYLVASYDGQQYSATRHEVEFDIRVERIYGVLTESLYATLKSLGEQDQLVANMAELLQWDIDFTAIQRGDWFKLVTEKRYLEDEFVGYGRIFVVQFNTGGKDFYGFRFENPTSGKVTYYDDKGNALRKAFLKVPFSFSPRISSGFSYSRFHPILKRRRAHPAVDFAAPRGTPVLASATGRVVFAGRSGGLGKLVKIRHSNGYTTSYAHLSKILVKSGQMVQQSQRIGRVGSTGLATGAHLDYRIQTKSGKYLNPRKKISWPSDKPIDKKYWSEFVAVRDSFLDELASIPTSMFPTVAYDKAD